MLNAQLLKKRVPTHKGDSYRTKITSEITFLEYKLAQIRQYNDQFLAANESDADGDETRKKRSIEHSLQRMIELRKECLDMF